MASWKTLAGAGLLLASLIAGTTPSTAFADTTSASQSPSVPYAVIPVLPSNQIAGTRGYFNLSVQPGQTEKVQVAIRNVSTHPITVDMTPVNATTAQNGGVNYDVKTSFPNAKLLDPNYAIAQDIEVQNSVSVPAGKLVTVPVTIHVPQNVSKGVILGGLTFEEDKPDSASNVSDKKNAVSITVKNKVRYAVAIELNLSSADTPVYNIGDAHVSMLPAGPQVTVDMENPSATVLDNVNGKFQILDSHDKVLFSGDFGPFRMAPKSQINYPIPWQASSIGSGDYKISITENTYYHGKTIVKPFSINHAQVVTYKNFQDGKAPTAVVDDGFPWMYAGIGAGGIVLLAVVIFLVAKTAKRKKRNKRAKRERYYPEWYAENQHKL